MKANYQSTTRSVRALAGIAALATVMLLFDAVVKLGGAPANAEASVQPVTPTTYAVNAKASAGTTLQ